MQVYGACGAGAGTISGWPRHRWMKSRAQRQRLLVARRVGRREAKHRLRAQRAHAGRRRGFRDRVLEVVHVGEAGHAGPDHLGAAEPRAEPDEVGTDERPLDRHHVAHQPDVEPQVVGEAAQQRHRHVRVRVDQARHDDAAAAVDRLGGRDRPARPGPTATIESPVDRRRAPGRWTVNCGSIVRTRALVSSRSQVALATPIDYRPLTSNAATIEHPRAAILLPAMALALGAGSAAWQAPREWRDYAGGPDSSRFVAATQITKANVGRLEVAWTYPDGQTDFNPLVVRGVVYGRGPATSFVALDAATGKRAVDQRGRRTGFNVRGINYWESTDGTDRRLLFSANNFLQAIDAQTGEPITSFGDERHASTCASASIAIRRRSTSRSRTPGRVFENLIILGSATNQEYASAPGDIRAFDVRTGALVWTFHTVPRPGEFGYDTWPPDAWKTVGGANNWGEQSIDETRGIVYVPTAQPEIQLLRRQPQGREPVRRLPPRARCAHRQAAVALPDGASRHLGSRQQLRAAADDDPPQRPRDRRRRGGEQDRISLRLRSRHRRADLADRRAPGAAANRRARRSRCGRRSRSRRVRRRSRGRRSRPTI